MKKILAGMLCVVMLCTILPLGALTVSAATSGWCGDNLTWNYDTSTATLTISGTGEMSNYSERYYSGNHVTTAPWREYYKAMKTVVIGTGVTAIGSSAFYGCTGLTGVYITDVAAWCNITFNNVAANPLYYAHNLYLNGKLVTDLVIPQGVAELKKYAFYNCTSLTSVTIPDSVTTIGSSAFFGCTGLTGVYISDVAAWCNINISFVNNPLYYAHNLYLNGELVTDLVIPQGVTEIKDSAFFYCTSLTSVTIPDSVTTIGSSAFYGCTGLTSVTIGNSVTTIGSSAFYGCTGLTSVNIPESVTTIGESAFQNCTCLTSIAIPDSVTAIGSQVFADCMGLTSITMPNSITSIGINAFPNCTGLTSVNIPESVTTIDACAFFCCTGLTSVVIPDSVTIIGNGAFYGCSKLKDVYYYGTMLQWEKISIGSSNTNLTDATIHCESYCLVNGHELGEITVLEDATCTENGSGTAVCIHCGETVTVEIPAAHSGMALRTVAPTCTADGYDICRCMVCGSVYYDHTVPALGHDFDDGVITTQPNCMETGVKTCHCSRCDATNPVSVPALGHNYTAVVTAPTCAEDGYTTHTCTRCNDSYTDTPVAAIGHNYKATTVPATCTEDGYKLYTCKTCGDTYTGVGAPAQGHFIFDGECLICGKTERQCEDLKVGTQTHKNGNTRLIIKLSATAEEIEKYKTVGVVLNVDGVKTELTVDSIYDSFYNNNTLITAANLNCTYVAILEIGNLSAAQSVTVQGFYTDETDTAVYGAKRTIK